MITLAQAKVTMVDPVDQMVIDEFRRSSQLMDLLPFANDVAPATGGQTLVYGYTKLKTPSVASFRGLNEEYTPGEAIKERKNAYLKILGGSFKLDRVVIGTAGAVDELNFQLKQKIAATTNLFHYIVINGNATSNEKEFDGLATLLADSPTEKTCATDISTSALMDANYNAFLDEVTEWLATLAEKPTALLMNSKALTKMKSIARRAGYYSRTEDAFGRTVDNWDNIPMLDMGQYFNGTKSVNCVPNDSAKGTTSIYAICAQMDGFHGVSLQGENVVTSHLPDLNQPGVIKEGDVEFVGCVALKNSLKAGVLKDIKIAPENTLDAQSAETQSTDTQPTQASSKAAK